MLPRASWIDIDGRARPLRSSSATRSARRRPRWPTAPPGLALAYRVLPTNYVLGEAEQDLV